MKTYRNFMATFIVIAIVAVLFFACNKEREVFTNNHHDDELVVDFTNCESCNSQFYEPTISQQKAIMDYLIDGHTQQTKDSIDFSFIGSVDLWDETVDWSMIAVKKPYNNDTILTFFLDNNTNRVESQGVASFTIYEDTLSFSFAINGHLYLEAEIDVQNGIVLNITEYEGESKSALTVGGNIAECYRIAKTACQNDPDCSTECDFIGWPVCDAAFFLGCVGHHIKARIVAYFS